MNPMQLSSSDIFSRGMKCFLTQASENSIKICILHHLTLCLSIKISMMKWWKSTTKHISEKILSMTSSTSLIISSKSTMKKLKRPKQTIGDMKVNQEISTTLINKKSLRKCGKQWQEFQL